MEEITALKTFSKIILDKLTITKSGYYTS